MSARAVLALEDGTVFSGRAFGAAATVTGEVCFNTGMTGYQEVLTDPSYHGQIVTMTAPQIGNTGVNAADEQSRRPWVAGFVVRDAARLHSNWRAEASLNEYLVAHGVPGISDIDTRRLTRHIRDRGAMRGALSTETDDAEVLVERALASPSMVGLDLARAVSIEEPYEHGDGPLRVAAYDFGMKRNILELLAASGCTVTVLPATTPAAEVLAGRYDGVFLSNGPGDPEPVSYGIDNVRALLGKVPVFGICLGHQILALALGGRTFKLPFGHRGSNHPVMRLDDSAVEITCQNHGFAVDPASLEATGARLTHVNLNDRTVEGLELPGTAFSVQYHPESAPGPHDSRYLFERFRQTMTAFEPTDAPQEVRA